MIPPPRIEKLRREHAVEGFDRGQEELNRYLARFALTNQQAAAIDLSGDLPRPG